MRFDLDELNQLDQSDPPDTVKTVRGRSDLDWLARNGGWVLLAFGIGLIALATAIANKEAVAAIFAFCGVASAVFGVLLPRLEGSFVFSPTKFAATLAEARKVGIREDLTLEERADLILRLLDVEGDERKHAKRVDRKERLLKRSLGVSPVPERHYPLPQPPPFARPSDTDRVHETLVAFEAHVAAAFREAGWAIEELGPASPFDFVATQEGEKNNVEVKLSRRFSAADAQAFIAAADESIDPGENERCVLVVNRGALSEQASQAFLGSSFSIQVLEVPVEGW